METTATIICLGREIEGGPKKYWGGRGPVRDIADARRYRRRGTANRILERVRGYYGWWKAELVEHCYMFSFLIDDRATEQSVDISVVEDFEL